jgi:hypothetical protein
VPTSRTRVYLITPIRRILRPNRASRRCEWALWLQGAGTCSRPSSITAVSAFDTSIEGKRKTELLALKKGVSIDYSIDDYEFVNFPHESFDCVTLIFAHMNSANREDYHKKLISFLKPGGTLILEGFSKNQINNKTGGPRDINMLFSEKEMNTDFVSCSDLNISEAEIVLNEGPFHQGLASVIRVVGIK